MVVHAHNLSFEKWKQELQALKIMLTHMIKLKPA